MLKRIINFLFRPFSEFFKLMEQENDKRLRDEIQGALDYGDIVRAEKLNQIRKERLCP